MKANIHPVLNEITARCACGNAFQTMSVMPEIEVSICSACHPFYTGAQKFIDTAGRIEKFEKRFNKATKKK